MAPTLIFLLGGTGFIGGSVLARLLNAPSGMYSVSALVRAKEKAPLLESVGVRPILGSLSDFDVLEKEAAAHDVTIHTADADDIPAAKALLKGLKKRAKETGKKPLFIHTSGTGVLADDARGEFAYDTVYDDADVKQINGLPDYALHRDVDLAILDASEEINAHIILPSTIYGVATHDLVKKGIAHAHSIQVPALVRASIARMQAGVVGKGLNKWPNVNVAEVAEIYTLVLTCSLSGKLRPSTSAGSYFFGVNGEHDLIDVSRTLGRTLAARGIGQAEPTTFTDEDIKTYFGGSYYLGSNSRAKASRARELGWKPAKTTKDFLESIELEVETILKED